jgi:hypothetical protein
MELGHVEANALKELARYGIGMLVSIENVSAMSV